MNDENLKSLLRDKIKQITNANISNEKINVFFDFMEFLLEENEKYNLTRITNRQDFVNKHIIDSLYILKLEEVQNILNKKDKIKIIDIGTGAGFPGIPLAIMLDDVKFTLVDSLNKRINFIKQIIEKYKLNNVVALHKRAEDLQKDKNYIKKYDIVVSRAVAAIDKLSMWTIPFMKDKGISIFYKMSNCDEEIEAATKNLTKLEIKNIKKINYDIVLKEDEPLHALIVCSKK